MSKCRADGRYGPVLFVEGEGARVELDVLPEVSDREVHGLAMIGGEGHEIQLKRKGPGWRSAETPVWIGFSAPAAGEGMSGFGETESSGLKIRNETNVPVVIGRSVSDALLLSAGRVIKNRGKKVKMIQL